MSMVSSNVCVVYENTVSVGKIVFNVLENYKWGLIKSQNCGCEERKSLIWPLFFNYQYSFLMHLKKNQIKNFKQIKDTLEICPCNNL